MKAVCLFAIYRRRNAAILGRMMAAADVDQPSWHLWALDEVAPSLQRWTVGVGPGAKFTLLNELVLRAAPPDDAHLVFLDDDVTFRRGTLARLLEVVEAGRFDLAQPAHARASHASFPFTRRRWWLRARATTFVEIGPLFVCASGTRAPFVPFDPDAGMGWGLELSWWDAQAAGARLGIVDDVTIVHHSPIGHHYDLAGERAANEQRLRARGLERMADMQAVVRGWPRWRRQVPWRQGSSP